MNHFTYLDDPSWIISSLDRKLSKTKPTHYKPSLRKNDINSLLTSKDTLFPRELNSDEQFIDFKYLFFLQLICNNLRLRFSKGLTKNFEYNFDET